MGNVSRSIVQKSPLPSIAALRREVAEGVRAFESFVRGLDQFGRELGEAWHPLADEMIGRFMALEKAAGKLKAKTSMPAAERAVLARQIEEGLSRLKELRKELLDAIPATCPPAGALEAPDEKTKDSLSQRRGIFK